MTMKIMKGIVRNLLGGNRNGYHIMQFGEHTLKDVIVPDPLNCRLRESCKDKREISIWLIRVGLRKNCIAAIKFNDEFEKDSSPPFSVWNQHAKVISGCLAFGVFCILVDKIHPGVIFSVFLLLPFIQGLASLFTLYEYSQAKENSREIPNNQWFQ